MTNLVFIVYEVKDKVIYPAVGVWVDFAKAREHCARINGGINGVYLDSDKVASADELRCYFQRDDELKGF